MYRVLHPQIRKMGADISTFCDDYSWQAFVTQWKLKMKCTANLNFATSVECQTGKKIKEICTDNSLDM